MFKPPLLRSLVIKKTFPLGTKRPEQPTVGRPTLYMYSIKIRINHLKKELVHISKDQVGVRLKGGRIKYMHYGVMTS